jgi:hypothetical protein
LLAGLYAGNYRPIVHIMHVNLGTSLMKILFNTLEKGMKKKRWVKHHNEWIWSASTMARNECNPK